MSALYAYANRHTCIEREIVDRLRAEWGVGDAYRTYNIPAIAYVAVQAAPCSSIMGQDFWGCVVSGPALWRLAESHRRD